MANLITISRIALTLALLCLPALSRSFFVVYGLAGVSDMLDGVIARKTGTASEAGARLDTAADLVFTVVCLCKLLPVVALPVWLWVWIAGIAAIKLANLLYGFAVRRELTAVHSGMNKLTGLLLFLLPLTLPFLDVRYGGGAVCAIATLAAIGEGRQIRLPAKQRRPDPKHPF